MTEIKILKSITSSKLNDLFNNINQLSLDNITLTLPGSLNKYRFGLLAELLRLVVTLNSKRTIQFLRIDLEKEHLEELYDQEYAYPIISLLWNTSNFLDKKGNNIKSLLRDKQNEYFIKMNSLARFKGQKYILVNSDHLSNNNGLIKLLENSEGFNDNEKQISTNINFLLSKYVVVFNKNNLTEIEDIMRDIGAIIYELTKNTFEWGKTDSNFVDLDSSIRGVYLRFHRNKRTKLSEEYQNTPIGNFFDHPKVLKNMSLNKLQQIYYLEILVFDSGVGFIEKFNQKDDLSDIDIIKKCLIKNQTSSTTNLKSKKGIGLDRILNILNGKGFLKICTDKYSVYRDLVKDEYQPIENNNLTELILE